MYKTEELRNLLQRKGEELYRDMAWREDTRPYYVLVSELMLQQTQVTRVIPKFDAFIDAFPSEKELAAASLADVLIHWQGLGYNRRAKFLHEAAKQVVARGAFPDTHDDLLKLSGVGKNTAGAILAYSFNQPSIFIETNIRTVYIHHFFNDNFDVSDSEIIELVKQTLDVNHPREFYWGLMDYGSWLKTNGVRNNSQSKHYKKQSPLAGSLREMRGMIIRNLSNGTGVELLKDDARFEQAIKDLEREVEESYHTILGTNIFFKYFSKSLEVDPQIIESPPDHDVGINSFLDSPRAGIIGAKALTLVSLASEGTLVLSSDNMQSIREARR